MAGLNDHRENKEDDLDVQYAPSHSITLTPGGLLQRLAGGTNEARVNSLHGQGIERLGVGLTVEAIAPDGLIEAVERERCARLRAGCAVAPGMEACRRRALRRDLSRVRRRLPRSNAQDGRLWRDTRRHACLSRPHTKTERTIMHDIDEFLKKHHVTEIEAIIPDMAGISRGKIIPRSKFESGESMRLPQAVMIQTVTGDYPEDGSLTGVTDPDMVCVPDASTIRMIPWAVDPDRPGDSRLRPLRRHAGR